MKIHALALNFRSGLSYEGYAFEGGMPGNAGLLLMGFGHWQIVAGCFTLSLLTAMIFEILSTRYLRHVHWP